ncbi:beta/gamma crystallin domain-containing protein [Photorhabdus viridis]|uniref:beta/gamma crystallin domain-containing protein n=1 Tax=Photorhabdus viridis TaxID=3163327 RepID=UPI0033078FBB
MLHLLYESTIYILFTSTLRSRKNDKIINHRCKIFRRKNDQGKSHEYPGLDRIISLPSELNDKFRSVRIGKLSKVHIWHHYNDPENKYYEWVIDNPDIDK